MRDERGDDGELLAPSEITCIDCGGPAHLLSRFDDENPPRPGDLLTYRCELCLDRWDLVIPGGDEEEE